jgi:hypothetical protein
MGRRRCLTGNKTIIFGGGSAFGRGQSGCTPADQAIIAAFNSRLAEETEGKTLSPDLIGPGLAAILTDSTKGRYWLAFVGGEVAGQIMMTYAWSN